jgi:ABC-type transport system substrate-binding protein
MLVVMPARCLKNLAYLVAATLVALSLVASARAQEPAAPKRLFEQEPFDRLTLDSVNDNAVIVVETLDLPNHQVPAKHKPGERLKYKVKGDEREFTVPWANIAKVELFEGMVLAEADKLTAAGKFDEAYDYFEFLLENYPQTHGLAASRQAYLYLSAGTAFRQGKYHEALAILEELWHQNASFQLNETSPSLEQVLSSIVDKIMDQYVQAEDYRSARTLLVRIVSRYSLAKSSLAKRWRTRFEELAGAQRDAAHEHLAAGRYVEAHEAVGRMQNIWPQVEGGAELAAEVARRYPLVAVGVMQPARALDAGSLIDVGARRAGRLVERRLCEFAGFGLEGGTYVCPFGTIQNSEDRLELAFDLRSGENAPNGQDLAARLLSLADPKTQGATAWSRLVKSVSVKNVQHVEVTLRIPHVLPEALLQVSFPDAPTPQKPGELGLGPYVPLSLSDSVNRFTKNPDDPLAVSGQPAEVLERWFEDPQRALLALQRGEIDVLDCVQPADLPTLRNQPDIAVVPYAAPVTHALIPGRANPFVENRTFRRGLQYGIAREVILAQAIGQGANVPGNMVVSGVFPAPKSNDDPAGYGYDSRVAARPFEPRLGYTLALIGQREVLAAAQKRKASPPKFAPLVLGHPADEPIRKACQAIAKQWKAMKVECQLLEFPPGVCSDVEGKCDLVYAQLAAWEPIVDAGRLLGPSGLVPTSSPHLLLALRQIESARNWRDARERLEELHRAVHEDLTIIPLWQTNEHFAYRKNIQGLKPGIVTLYQNVQDWRVTPRISGGRGA